MRTESRLENETPSNLIDRDNEQMRLVGELHMQFRQHLHPEFLAQSPQPKESQSYKMTKTPDLHFVSGELAIPKGEAKFDNWIFQIKFLQKTHRSCNLQWCGLM